MIEEYQYQYGQLKFTVEFITLDSVHSIYVSWTGDTLYEFPIANTRILWEKYPENALLIPEDIQSFAQDVVDNHLLTEKSRY